MTKKHILTLLAILICTFSHAQSDNLKPFKQWDATAFCIFNVYHPHHFIRADNNWEILNALRNPQTLAELKANGINCTNSQLMFLNIGGLISKANGKWYTTMPIFDEQKTDTIRKMSRQIAESILKETETDFLLFLDVIRENGFERNAFSITFSYLLDGQAWKIIMPDKDELGTHPTWSGANWVMFSPREQKVGTNSYGCLHLTWTDISRISMPTQTLLSDFAKEYEANQRVTDKQLAAQLSEWGLTDKDGNIIIPVIDEGATSKLNNISNRIIGKMNKEMDGSLLQFMQLSNVKNPKVAAVILYHEMIWDMIDLLQEKGIVTMPTNLKMASSEKTDLAKITFLTTNSEQN